LSRNFSRIQEGIRTIQFPLCNDGSPWEFSAPVSLLQSNGLVRQIDQKKRDDNARQKNTSSSMRKIIVDGNFLPMIFSRSCGDNWPAFRI